MIKKLLGLLALLTVAYSAHAEIYVQATVPLVNEEILVHGGKYSYYDFTLTNGDELVVDFELHGGLDGSLYVWLLDLANFQRYEARQNFSYFDGPSGKITYASRFRFKAPEANIYYMVLDNRRAFVARKVKTNAYKVAQGETGESKAAAQFYSTLYNDFLKTLFVFDDFDIYVQKCGTANAYSSPDITICRELNDLILNQNAPEAMKFVFFHEAAHSLLNIWGMPMYDNEDSADELATAILLLTNQKIDALGAAKWWANRGSKDQVLAKMWLDDRHSISAQRARNIINWINDEDELTQRWLRFLLPNMTDEAVQAYAGENPLGIDTRIARQELAKRQALK